jgi:hypothetical protein
MGQGGEEVYILILDRSTRFPSSVTPRPRFLPGLDSPRWIGGWVGLRTGPVTEAREKNHLSLPGNRIPVVQSVVRHYTDWAAYFCWQQKWESLWSYIFCVYPCRVGKSYRQPFQTLQMTRTPNCSKSHWWRRFVQLPTHWTSSTCCTPADEIQVTVHDMQ